MSTPRRANGLTNTVVQIVSVQPASIGAVSIYNASAAVGYLQVFDASSPSAVTLGTTVPNWVIAVPTLATVSLTCTDPARFEKGIQIAFTTTATGSSAPSVAADVALTIVGG